MNEVSTKATSDTSGTQGSGTRSHPTVTPITIKRAADQLGKTIWEVRALANAGELPSAMLNGRRFVALEDVRALRRAL